ncbi:CBS-domain-containing membrane protein [Synechococcus sp. PCC 7502]|uniref:HPP family protein n=1 Tax=Synechococcus sp. PCC 7502 TaxID=1173263 RepID=UPI00029F9B1C|nr:HPP family protein [Synechococcus sp. PCC 7502]AFY72444.1 CBS-domain-containing membrane protein [Synechococcus sp. PCC 7502]
MISFQKIYLKWQSYWFKLFTRWRECPLTCPIQRPHHKHVFWSWLGSCLAITIAAYLSVITNCPLIMAPFGATSVLIFGVPESPLAQPRNVLGGNLIAALVSLIILNIWGSSPWTMGLAVSIAIAIMQFTNTLHPPSGAVALVVMMTKPNWQFLVTPTLEGSMILVLCAVIFNNLSEERTYPKHWL